MSDSIESQGTRLEIRLGSPVTFVNVAEVKDFTAIDGSAAEIETTHLLSTAKEFRMGLPDNGNLSFTCNYVKDDRGQTALRSAHVSREKQTFKMVFSDNSTIQFDGFVTTVPLSGSVDGIVEESFTVRITGDVTYG